MAELKVKIPDDLEEEFKQISEMEISLFVTRMLEGKLERLARLKRTISKSQLSERDVKELSDKVDRSLSKRFKQSLKE